MTPAQTRRVTMSVSLSADLANKVEKAADKQKLSLSAYIRHAIEEALRAASPRAEGRNDA